VFQFLKESFIDHHIVVSILDIFRGEIRNIKCPEKPVRPKEKTIVKSFQLSYYDVPLRVNERVTGDYFPCFRVLHVRRIVSRGGGQVKVHQEVTTRNIKL